MQKRIVYAGAVPFDLDWLEPQRNAEYALGRVMQAVLGTSVVIDGLAASPQSVPDMTVQVSAGAIFTYTTVDPTGMAYGALPLDTNNLTKVGINRTVTNMSAVTAPATSGQSQNWLLEAQFLEQDTTPVALPYYNAGNPAVPFTGPSDSGTAQNTQRTNTVSLQWKAGTSATTGTQATPSPDAGWVGVAVITVPNGTTSITSANIVPYITTPRINTVLPNFRKRLTADLALYVSPTGNDNNTGLAAWDPLATMQKVWSNLVGNYDLNGHNVTINLASGTYSTGLLAQGALQGQGSGNVVSFIGNNASPGSCIVSVTGQHAVFAANGANIALSGVTLTATGTVGGTPASAVVTSNGGNVTINGPVVFGTVTGQHLWATQSSGISVSSAYTITGGGQAHYLSQACSTLIVNPTGNITVSGGLTFSSAFAVAQSLGLLQVTSAAYTSSTTGPRYLAGGGGVINTNGGGGSYFPGSIAGTAATGQYQ